MAASSTVTYDNGEDYQGRLTGIRRVTIDWTSASDGSVTATTKKICGELVKAVTNPGATAPTASYDIAITDEESFDVLTNTDDNLADRHTSTTEEVYFLVKDHAGTPLAQSVHPVVCDVLSVAVTNAGDSKVGRIVIYYKPL